MRKLKPFVWEIYHLERPFKIEQLWELLSHLASLSPRGFIVMETRADKSCIRYFIGAAPEDFQKIHGVFHAHVNAHFKKAATTDRINVQVCRQLKITKPILSLNIDASAAAIRAGLAALSSAHEETVLQIILGSTYRPTSVPKNLPNPNAGWLEVIMGTVGSATPECRKSAKEKAEQHGFQCLVRVGANGKQAISKINDILSALRTLESAGVRIHDTEIPSAYLNNSHIPWQLSLKLSVKELTPFLLLPAGEEEFPGVSALHPKVLLPPAWYKEPTENSSNARIFAISENHKKLSISPSDSLEHTHILGPTGSGKSTVMLRLIMADITAGRSVLVIDPKADLIRDILERVPDSRMEDVVVIDPSDDNPVGFNPFTLSGYQDPNLVADAILSVFQQIFKEYWGIRTQDILSAALLTLTKTPGASLLWLPALLTDAAFRERIVRTNTDRLGLMPFWRNYDSMKDNERRTEIAPVLNKLRQLTMRPSLRSVLGQSYPKFSFMDLFLKRKVVLVPLNKGLIGSESAKLLGSLIVGLTWTLTLTRANIPPEKRHIIAVYIDELQDYLSLPTDLSDALSQARGLGVSMTLVHQYRSQLPPEIRAGIDTNARNKISFGLSGSDAKDMAAIAPGLDAVDFMSLPRYQIYTAFQSLKINTGWIKGTTYPASSPIRIAAELKAASMERYGKASAETEQELLSVLYPEESIAESMSDTDSTNASTDHTASDYTIGRKKRHEP